MLWPATVSVGMFKCGGLSGTNEKGCSPRREDGSLGNPTVESAIYVMLVSWHVLFELAKKEAEKSGPGSQGTPPPFQNQVCLFQSVLQGLGMDVAP